MARTDRLLANWRGSLVGPRPAVDGTASGACHVRDSMSLDRAMNCVLVALVPCLLIGLYNTGLHANHGMATLKLAAAPGWRGAVMGALGIGYDPASVTSSFIHGLLIYLPVFVVTTAVGSLWEAVFATFRDRATGHGFLVIAMLFSLSLPPTVALWQAALGISFAIVIGKEIFGGTGKNFLNPALTGLAFLYVTYPKSMISEHAWSAVDGFTGATALRAAAEGGIEAIAWTGTTWMQSFIGLVPGPFGATSTVACLLGAIVLIYTRVASARIMVGALVGMVATVLLFNHLGADDPYFSLPWRWHLTLGSFAFGIVFFATDPVTATMTDRGRWIYGLLIGFMIILIRVVNSAHPDGVIFAILFANIFAPLIDYLVMRADIRRRARRNG